MFEGSQILITEQTTVKNNIGYIPLSQGQVTCRTEGSACPLNLHYSGNLSLSKRHLLTENFADVLEKIFPLEDAVKY